VELVRMVKTVFARINDRRMWPFLAFVASTAIVIAGWLCLPALLHPYVRVPGAIFSFSVPCIPENVQVETITPYAVLTRAKLMLQDRRKTSLLAQYDLDIASKRAGGGINFTLIASPNVKKQMSDAMSGPNAGSQLAVSMEFTKIPAIDLVSVDASYAIDLGMGGCRPENISAETLMKRLDDPRARTMRYALIQDKLSDFILNANEIGGNIVLAGLVLMFLWLTVLFVEGVRRVYLLSDSRLRADLLALVPAATEGRKQLLANMVSAQYSSVFRRLAFARVFGPATGFLLTVSSLVAALHPSAAAAQDTFRFVSSLQLALVATFMGLVVRIMAELALRFHRDDAERKLQAIELSCS
jgi:hypothetical protein